MIERPGTVTRDALTSEVDGLAVDLLQAETSQDFLRVGDHLRLLAMQCEAYASRLYRQEHPVRVKA